MKYAHVPLIVSVNWIEIQQNNGFLRLKEFIIPMPEAHS